MKLSTLVLSLSLTLPAAAHAARATDDWSPDVRPTRPQIDDYARGGRAQQQRQERLSRGQAEDTANQKVWQEFHRAPKVDRRDYSLPAPAPAPRAPERRYAELSFDQPWYREPVRGQAEIHILPNYTGYNKYDHDKKLISNFNQLMSAAIVAPGQPNAACFSGYARDAAEIFYQMVDLMNAQEGTRMHIRMYTYYDGTSSQSDALRVMEAMDPSDPTRNTNVWFNRIQRCHTIVNGKNYERWSTARERANRPWILGF